MTKIKKALIIANKIIFPALDGGSMAMKQLTSILTQQNYIIDIIAISKNNKEKSTHPIKKSFNENKITQFTFYKKMSLNIKNVFKSIFNGTSYQANRFFHEKIKHFIQNLINKNQYDIIIFESIFTTIYKEKLNISPSTKIIFRAHNVEHKIWQDLAKQNLSKRIIYLLLAKQIRKLEQSTPKQVNYILTLSELDKKYFKKYFPNKTFNLPVFFNTSNNTNKKIPKSIVHLGAMDWKPNIDGIDWFMREVVPQIKKNVKIYIAGKNMPQRYINYNSENINIHGKVDDAIKYIQDKSIMFVPLFSGSGIRIKILEGMSLGIPIISTSKGAQGIPYKNKENILIADNAEDFIKAIYLLINNDDLAKKIGKNGQKLIQNNFSKQYAINKWEAILK